MLILWDVDHTLIESGGVGRELYHHAFTAVTGVEVGREVDVTGKTEQAIFEETARQEGVEPSQAMALAYRSELARQYELHLDDLRRRGRVLPHAREALADLAERADVLQTVLTGNFRAVAEVKLRAFDLDVYVDLDSGAYGEDAPVARDRARRRHDHLDDSETIVIGDSPADVSAARGRATVIAVATGSASEDDLRSAGANVVLRDLSTAAEVLRRWPLAPSLDPS
jgi:phosphoglycolate phosphatase-like HAD superfamily hydrolase